MIVLNKRSLVSLGALWSSFAGVLGVVGLLMWSVLAQREQNASSMPGSSPPGYVEIPAGSFIMGSPSSEWWHEDDEDQVRVSVSGFYLKAHEVTQGEWEALMGSHPSEFKGCDRCPVGNVSWYDALEYLNRLSRAQGLEACYEINERNVKWIKGLKCKGYRLPTEAEWEYSARGRTTGAHYGDLYEIAWYSKNSEFEIHQMGLKRANSYGLYDVLGNVEEWTWDEYREWLPGGDNPVVGGYSVSLGAYRVIRGCTWYDGAYWCRAAQRAMRSPWDRRHYLGLRPARSLAP